MSSNGKKPDDLATRLGLTQKQRLFAEALAADPERNQTKAAIVAGLGKHPEAAGCRMASLAKVQEYVAALTGKAIRRANAHTEDAVASLQESLLILTAQARSAAAWKTTRRKATLQEEAAILAGMPEDQRAKAGQWLTVDAEEYEPGRAASKLLDFHAGKTAQPAGDRTLIINILDGLPGEQLREMALGLLTDGNGNGHR